MRIDTASNIGTANRNIIIEPCSVKSWLNVDAETRSLSGTASCARMTSASTPANSIIAKAVSVYQTPDRVVVGVGPAQEQPFRRRPDRAQSRFLCGAHGGVVLVRRGRRLRWPCT